MIAVLILLLVIIVICICKRKSDYFVNKIPNVDITYSIDVHGSVTTESKHPNVKYLIRFLNEIPFNKPNFFVVSVNDGNGHHQDNVFMNSFPKDKESLLFPDFEHIQNLYNNFYEKIPDITNKQSKIIWRGLSKNGTMRKRFIKYLDENRDIEIDSKENIDIPKLDYYSKYQTVIVLDGWGAAFRVPSHFYGKQCVLMATDYKQWYSDMLIPWYHYIPIESDFSNLREIILFVKENPKLVKQIGENAKAFFNKHLTKEATLIYIKRSVENAKEIERFHNQINNVINHDSDVKITFLWKENSTKVCDMENVWGTDKQSSCPVEISYLREILPNDFDYYSKDDVTTDILIYSSNLYSAHDIQEIVNKLNPKILINLSDESKQRPDHQNINVPLILRNYHVSSYPARDNMYVFPLGYHCWDTETAKNIKPVSKRKYIWNMIGSVKDSRKRDCEYLESKLKPCFYGSTKQKQNYDILNNSIFTYCPSGNTSLECFRQYAAMRNGSIPIIVASKKDYDEAFSHFGDSLIFDPPWIRVSSVDEFVKKVNKLLENPKAVQDLSDKQIRWWDNSIKNTKQLILDGLKDKYF